jgi:homoserine dehydrogenase
MTEYSLALIGFGNVGRAFARLLLRKKEILRQQFDVSCKVTGIATGRHGFAIDPAGIDLTRALSLVESSASLNGLSAFPAPASGLDFIDQCPAGILFENSPVDYQTGQPAVDYLKAALNKGMHAVTANKGPVVHAFAELTALARHNGVRFLFESTVMDGAPIFSLFRGALPAAELRGFQGILNSCTNLILGLMEKGKSFDEAVRYAQSIGIAETDPSGDIDGWDAAIKVSALATVLMGAPLKPQQIDRTGIRAISPAMLADARQAGERWKLVCSARLAPGGGVEGRVAPQRVPASSPLYSVDGTSSYIQFETDVLPALGIIEGNPGPETTAFGLLADLINIVRGQ